MQEGILGKHDLHDLHDLHDFFINKKSRLFSRLFLFPFRV